MVLNESVSSRAPWPPPLGLFEGGMPPLLIVLRPFEAIPEKTDGVSRAFLKHRRSEVSRLLSDGEPFHSSFQLFTP